jgi:hypothetical protein
VLLGIGGVMTRTTLQTSKWQTQKALTIKKYHRAFAYFTILLSIGAVFTGIKKYRTNPVHPSDTEYEIYYCVSFVITAWLVDRLFKCFNSKEIPYDSDSEKTN